MCMEKEALVAVQNAAPVCICMCRHLPRCCCGIKCCWRLQACTPEPHSSALSVCRHLHQLMDMPLTAPAMLPMCMETRAVSPAQNAAVSARLSESVGAEIGDVAQHQHQLGGLAMQSVIVLVE